MIIKKADNVFLNIADKSVLVPPVELKTQTFNLGKNFFSFYHWDQIRSLKLCFIGSYYAFWQKITKKNVFLLHF